MTQKQTREDHMSQDDRVLRTREAAAFLGIAPQTLRRWRLDGYGPAFTRLGRGRRSPAGYRRSDLERWLRSRTFDSTSAEAAAEGEKTTRGKEDEQL